MAAIRHGRRSSVAKHESFLRHANFRWLKIAGAFSLISLVIFIWSYASGGFSLEHSGSTWLGYTLGTVGAALIVWLALLGIRKRAMTEGNWSLKAWVSAHVYLGLSLLVIVTLHSGLQFGWNVHTLAYFLMMLVIVSGIFGIIAYSRLPRILSENRAEITQIQMLENLRGLDRRLMEAAQPLDERLAAPIRESLENTNIAGTLWQRLSNNHDRCPTLAARGQLQTLLSQNPQYGAQLQPILSLLDQKRTVLTQARRQIQLKAILEIWLYLHVPATMALMAALTAHIISVFFYW